MRKLLTGFMLTLVLLMAWPWLVERVEPLFSPADTVENLTDVIFTQMYSSATHKDAMSMVLYFRYMQTDYLAQEARELEIARNETVEMAIVRALMAGPSASSQELTALFSPNDQLRSVRRESEGTVTVVLGEQFMARPADAPLDWERYEYWQQEVPRRRRLALQAVTNSLTEGGRCDTVQFLIATAPEDMQGTRMLNAPINGGGPSELLPLQARNEKVVLTPRTALVVVFDAWERKDWMTLYTFLRRGSQGDTPLPSQTDFLTQIDAMERSLLFYSVSEGTVSVDGSSATLCVDLKVMDRQGDTRVAMQVPVEMVREHGSWKLAYDTLLRCLDR